MSILLESKGLHKNYMAGDRKEFPVLKEVDLTVHRDEFVSVMGPSGSGKSTLLYTVCGMDRMSSGQVFFGGRELSQLSEDQLASLRLNEMGFVFQQIHLLKNLSIFDNIVLSGHLSKSRTRGSVHTRAVELMKKTGILEPAKNEIGEASGRSTAMGRRLCW